MASSTNSPGTSFSLIQNDKLRGLENYGKWKFIMKMILIHEDLWDCVESNGKCDEKKSQKALARICLSVNSNIFPQIRYCKNAQEAWSNLEKAFEDKGLCRRLSLLRMLFSTKLGGDGMDSYLSKIVELSQQLQDINSPLDDDFVAVIMLSGLTADYDPLIMALENSNVKLSSDVVKAKLLQESQRRDNPDESATALSASRNTSRKPPKCYRCKKTGHFIKDCPKQSKKVNKEHSKLLLTALSVSIKSSEWYIDSGATAHMCNDKSVLIDFVHGKPMSVTVANGEKLETAGCGNVKVQLKDCLRIISNVYYVPKLSANLLSVSTLVSKGYKVVFNAQKCHVYDGNDVLASGTLDVGVYKLDICRIPCSERGTIKTSVTSVTSAPEAVVMAASSPQSKEKVSVASQETWHRRLGHLNSRSMALLKKGMVKGINYDSTVFQPCIACIEGKQSRLPFPKKSYTRASEVLGLVHTDLCGPLPVASFSGAKYFLCFIDDYSRKTFVYFLRSKDEVFEHFKHFKAMVENETSQKIKVLRSDNGGEFVNYKLQTLLKNNGIKHHTTVPHSPQQNGVAERANRTILEKARCMLRDAKLDNKFWAEAVNTAVYLKNRSPTKAVTGLVPEEKWTNKKVNLNYLHIFGCIAYAVSHNRKKLDSKCKRYIFVGYCEDTKGYRLLEPDSLKCIKARDVKFLENTFIADLADRSHDDIYKNMSSLNLTSSSVGKTAEANVQPNSHEISGTDESPEHSETSIITVSDSESGNSSDANNALDSTYIPGESSIEDALASSDYEDSMMLNESAQLVCRLSRHDEEPETVQEALNGPDAAQWKEAITDEYKSFIKNNCWTLTEKPSDQKPVKCKWIFKKKRGLNGELLKYKARLVAKGYTQQYGVDYEETFSPVVRYSTIRTLIAIAAQYNLNIDHLDVKTAFLNGDLKETVYMEQPEGFKINGKEQFVYKLNKAIYGLKQASRMWYEKINDVLMNKFGFRRTSSEPCVYFKRLQSEFIIIALYVDDILLFSSSNSSLRSTVKNGLMKEFEMHDLGPAHQILGMRICRQEDKITLDQSGYITKVLERFHMTECKPAKTPMEKGSKLTASQEKNTKYDYRNLIGCLMYIAVCSRPDISHAVSVLSQFNECHSETHWKAAKRVLRYLKGTKDHCLIFQKSELNVTAYVDADWAGDENDRKSYTGFVFKLGSSTISWESKKQKTVALSSTEAEYMALSDACKEALYVRSFLHELFGNFSKILIYNDNQSAQKLSSNHIHHSRTKHIDVRHHFIREIVNKDIIKIEYLSTDVMIADILTKPLTKEKHDLFLKGLGLVKWC